MTNYGWIKTVQKTTYILSHKTFSLSKSLTLSSKFLLKHNALLIRQGLATEQMPLAMKVGTIYGEHK